MRIPFLEPVSTKYLYINPTNNRVHLIVRVARGKMIYSDISPLKEFFNDGDALRELTAYEKALKLDIQLLNEDNPQRIAKEERLSQIRTYIEAINTMQYTQADVLAQLTEKTSGLYGIQLRTGSQSSSSQVVNPIFSINLGNDAADVPLSVLYQSMQRTFPTAQITRMDGLTELTHIILAALPPFPTLANIQQTLTTQCQRLFDLQIDFTQYPNGAAVEQNSLDALIDYGKEPFQTRHICDTNFSQHPEIIDPFVGFGDDDRFPKPEDYIELLLDAFATNIWEKMPISPFYSMGQFEEKTDHLSILTQSFLAQVTFYCKVHNISQQNFGTILDASSDLSNRLVTEICDALKTHSDIEENVCVFLNRYSAEFELSRPLSSEDIRIMKHQFIQNYKTLTDNEENISLSDFMILDTTNRGLFVIRQDFIYMSFAHLGVPALNSDYFEGVRQDFQTFPLMLDPKNAWILGEVEVEIDTLMACIEDEEQFEQLPKAVKKEAYRKYPILKLSTFLHDVAQGKQTDAEDSLMTSCDPQTLLLNFDSFTDYSGRTFNCTAYEYAYWAKDTHMCRMLIGYMNDATKTFLLDRINQMEHIDSTTNQPLGLAYQQNEREYRSVHFDMTPLKNALSRFVLNYEHWGTTQNWTAMKAGWMEVGLAQRDVPAHVAQEYCRPRRSFAPTPKFSELFLLRVLTFYNAARACTDSCLP